MFRAVRQTAGLVAFVVFAAVVASAFVGVPARNLVAVAVIVTVCFALGGLLRRARGTTKTPPPRG